MSSADRFHLSADVVIVGAGSAGCSAAIAAARAGASVILVERLPFLGGTSTAVLDTFYAFHTAGAAGRKVVSGIPDLPLNELRKRGQVFERPNSFGSGLGYTYNPETLKIIWAKLLREAGVRILLHVMVVGATVSPGGRLEALTLATKAGFTEVAGFAFIDAGGDADLTAYAGGTFQSDADKLQPATLTFRMGGVDIARFKQEGRPRLKELMAEGRRRGLDLPGTGGSLHEAVGREIAHTALVRITPPDITDPTELGRVETDAYAQIDGWLTFLKEMMPGFEHAEITAIGAMSGLRETRRVVGRYVLTEDDALSGRYFDDQVAICGAPLEDLSAETTRWVHIGGQGTYGIPWRCLLPTGVAGLAVAGRDLSATHGAHASARSMATCMALGQAAGTAAAIASASRRDIGDVPAVELLDRLRHDGATLEDPGS
jgi:hypothetical protein